MDDDLRTSLWNALHTFFWSHAVNRGFGGSANNNLKGVMEDAWLHFFKWSLADLHWRWDPIEERIAKRYDSAEWYWVYDFIEFMAPKADRTNYDGTKNYTKFCNQVLEAERSGYRFVGNLIVPVTSETEVRQIEDLLQTPYEIVRVQIQSALQKLSMKPKPDVRNCIKEAICAVESAARIILGVESGTLPELIPKLKSRFDVHEALAGSLKQFYGWTSDTARHGMREGDNLTVDDARLALVTCSAFANYLLRLGERPGTLKPPSV
jgi:hypothetical protein